MQTRLTRHLFTAIAVAAPIALSATALNAAQCVPPTQGFELITKAPVDECFDGVGNPYPEMIGGECSAGVPKRNQGYVWGMAENKKRLYWGTVANPPCVFFGGLGDTALPINLPALVAPKFGWVCEFGEGWLAQQNPNLENLGDWRAPKAYRMNQCTQELEEITPDNTEAIQDLLGIRAVGSIGNLVLMAGPGGVQTGVAGPNAGDSIWVLAFKADTGEFLGAKRFPQFVDIRQFINHDGVMYSGVALSGEHGGNGRILRWKGKVGNPFAYKIVGKMPSRPANLAIHNGRMFTSTWPNTDLGLGKVKAKAGIVMSPVIPDGGLKRQHAKMWETVWTVDEYEPDRAIAASYAGGALRSWKGKLYWGTMHFPTASFIAHTLAYGQTWNGPIGELGVFLATHRATAVFRGDFGGPVIDETDTETETLPPANVELLYGDAAVIAYEPTRQKFWLAPTKAGPARYGRSGFDWPFNAYVWQSGVTENDLFMGTFDSSRITAAAIEAIIGPIALPTFLQDGLDSIFDNPIISGADMYRFHRKAMPAMAADLNGGGNSANYGWRTMINKKNVMWLGTANPFNLAPEGGWELMRYMPDADPAPEPEEAAEEGVLLSALTGLLQYYLGNPPDQGGPLNDCVVSVVRTVQGDEAADLVAAFASDTGETPKAEMVPLSLAFMAAETCED